MQNLCQQVGLQGVLLDRRQAEGLITKLGSYCAERQWKIAAIEGQFPALSDAIGANPDGLVDPTLTLTKMVELHSVWNKQAGAALRRELLPNPSAELLPAEMARNADGAYRLVECLTQRHLQGGHGTHLDQCRDKMARGSWRIFSLRTVTGIPVATTEYNTRKKVITQIKGNSSPT